MLAGAKAAVDLIELTPSELAADTVALVALGLALTRVTTGDAVLVGSLLAIAFLGESFGAFHAAGIATILAGVILATRAPAR